jgi:hypothetical protein
MPAGNIGMRTDRLLRIDFFETGLLLKRSTSGLKARMIAKQVVKGNFVGASSRANRA